MDYYISESLLTKMGEGNSCMDLPENKAFALFTVLSKKYIVVASGSSGVGGMHWVQAYECVLLDDFKGESYSYEQNSLLINQGKKERGYENVSFSFQGNKWVIINKKNTFYPVKGQPQLTLF